MTLNGCCLVGNINWTLFYAFSGTINVKSDCYADNPTTGKQYGTVNIETVNDPFINKIPCLQSMMNVKIQKNKKTKKLWRSGLQHKCAQCDVSHIINEGRKEVVSQEQWN